MTRWCIRLSLIGAALLVTTSLTAPPAIAVEPDAPERQLSFDETIGLAAQARLSGQANLANGADKADMTAAAAIYDKRARQPLWVTPAGFSKRAETLIAEIRKADDWGLKASQFALPDLPAPGDSSVKLTTEQLAEAEATASLKRAHLQCLGQCQRLAIVSLGLLNRWRLLVRSERAEGV